MPDPARTGAGERADTFRAALIVLQLRLRLALIAVGIPLILLLGPTPSITWLSLAVLLPYAALAAVVARRRLRGDTTTWRRLSYLLDVVAVAILGLAGPGLLAFVELALVMMVVTAATEDQRDALTLTALGGLGLWGGHVFHGLTSADERASLAISVVIATAVVVLTGWLTRQRDAEERERAASVERERLEEAVDLVHDLRTPLSTIRGVIDLLGPNVERLDPDQRERLLEIASRNVTMLDQRVTELLEVARTSPHGPSGRATVTPISLARSVAEVVEDCGGFLSRHDVRIAVPDVLVPVDRSTLSHILSNLLSNAAKYSPPGSVIEVSGDAEGDHVTLRVGDEGRGIPAEELERVFERFARAGADDQPGTGIGLAIVRRHVEAVGGEIRIDSEPGVGTTVAFTLPLATSPPLRPRARRPSAPRVSSDA